MTVDDGAPSTRSAAQLLRDPRFGRYFAAKLTSTAGMWIHNVAASIAMYEITGSAFMVGLVSVGQFAPQLLLAPYSGVLADRGNRKRQALVGRGLVSFGSGLLAIWLAVGLHETSYADVVLIVVAVFVGLGQVVGGPAMHAIIPALVDRRDLTVAIALNGIPMTIARAAGPAIGGAIVIVWGYAPAFAVAALGNLLFVLMLSTVVVAGHRAPSSRRSGSLRTGLQAVRSDRQQATLLLLVALIGIGADPVITLAPRLSELLGYGTVLVGVFGAGFGSGAGVAFVFLAAARRRLGLPATLHLGLVLLGAGLMVCASGVGPLVVLAGFVIAGAGMTLSLSTGTTLLQYRAQDHMRGRVMALYSMAFVGTRPLAAAWHGFIADVMTAHVALAVSGLAIVGITLVVRRRVTLDRDLMAPERNRRNDPMTLEDITPSRPPSPSVLVERNGGVATITLNRPQKLNAADRELKARLLTVLTELHDDDEIRVVCLTGAGRGFCAGADLTDYVRAPIGEAYTPASVRELRAEMCCSELLRGMPKPTIAIVNGPCAGAGMSWASACDLRIAGDSAVFNTAFLSAGLSGDHGISWLLPRIVGDGHARDLLLHPRKVDAAHALRIGLVTEVVADDELLTRAQERAAALARLSPLAVGALKRNLSEAFGHDFARHLDAEADRQVRMRDTHDQREAVAAFNERREPSFTGS